MFVSGARRRPPDDVRERDRIGARRVRQRGRRRSRPSTRSARTRLRSWPSARWSPTRTSRARPCRSTAGRPDGCRRSPTSSTTTPRRSSSLGPSFPPIATHSSEIQYLFDQPNAPFAATLNADSGGARRQHAAAWANFAADGDPASAAAPWPSFNADLGRAVARRRRSRRSTRASPRPTTARSGPPGEDHESQSARERRSHEHATGDDADRQHVHRPDAARSDRDSGGLRRGRRCERLHYVEAGEGPLVVLLHGFPEFWFGWRLQIAPLAAAGFRVVAPDTRGYNLSSKPEGFEAYARRPARRRHPRPHRSSSAPSPRCWSVTTGAEASPGPSR